VRHFCTVCDNGKITEVFNVKNWDQYILRLFAIQKYTVVSINPKMGTSPAPDSLSMLLRRTVEEEGASFWVVRVRQKDG